MPTEAKYEGGPACAVGTSPTIPDDKALPNSHVALSPFSTSCLLRFERVRLLASGAGQDAFAKHLSRLQ